MWVDTSGLSVEQRLLHQRTSQPLTYPGGAVPLDLLVEPGDGDVGADVLGDHLAVLSDPGLVPGGLTVPGQQVVRRFRRLSSCPGSGLSVRRNIFKTGPGPES